MVKKLTSEMLSLSASSSSLLHHSNQIPSVICQTAGGVITVWCSVGVRFSVMTIDPEKRMTEIKQKAQFRDKFDHFTFQGLFVSLFPVSPTGHSVSPPARVLC